MRAWLAVFASLFATSCGVNCTDIARASVIVEAQFRGDGMAVDDGVVTCTVDGDAITADDSDRASGRYVCFGPPGVYDVRLTRSGIATGREVTVAGDACGTPVTETVELSVFGP